MQLKTLGVVGAGPMGAGIAQTGLTSKLDVVLYDVSTEALEKAANDIFNRIKRLEEKGKVEPGFADMAKNRLTLASDLSQFAPCEVIVEAIVERLDIKQKLFADLESVTAPDAILATNTSSLSVAAIAARCLHK